MLSKAIVIEGMDGSGKSTLAEALANHYECGRFLIGAPPSNDDVAQRMADDQIFIMRHKPIVFDRVTPISRLCYELNMSERHQELMFNMTDEILDYATVIWCNPAKHADAEVKTYDTATHLAQVKDNWDEINRNYHALMGMMNHVEYDFRTQTVEDMIDAIM